MRRFSFPGVDRCDSDAGSGTIWVLTLAALLWFVAVVSVLACQIRVVRHQAAAAADLAALAAAQRARSIHGSPCLAARRVARANGARVEGCTVRGYVADVTVTVPLPSPIRPLVPADGVIMRARAGPSSAGRLDYEVTSPDANG